MTRPRSERLVVEPASKSYVARLTVPNRVESVRPAVSFVVQTARALNIARAADPLFEVAVAEALTNAVKHGHSPASLGEVRDRAVSAPPLSDVIDCELELDARRFVLRVIDNGPGFVIPHPWEHAAAPAEVYEIPESGHGLHIIQSVFQGVRGVQLNGRFRLELSLPL